MPNPNALVDYVAPPDARTLGLAAGGEHAVISFQAGRSGRLDLSKPHNRVWASVLDSMRESNAPVYVEIDPATGEITNLRVPLSVGVENITPAGEDMEVELVISHAKHFLRRSNPDFEQLLETLERARANKSLVAVTETEQHDIIDVRPMAGSSVTARRDITPETSEGPVRLCLSRWGRRSRCSTWSIPRSVAQRSRPRPAFHSTIPTMAAGDAPMKCVG